MFGIVEAIAGILRGWIALRGARVEAEIAATVARGQARADLLLTQEGAKAAWEQAQVKASVSSWKDEFWTVILAGPMLAAFVPGAAPHIAQGFDTLSDTVPDWYGVAMLVAIGAAFGRKGLPETVAAIRGNKGN